MCYVIYCFFTIFTWWVWGMPMSSTWKDSPALYYSQYSNYSDSNTSWTPEEPSKVCLGMSMTPSAIKIGEVFGFWPDLPSNPWFRILILPPPWCWLQPEARSQAKPGQKKLVQAEPCAWPEVAFSLACDFWKPKPLAWAPAFLGTVSFPSIQQVAWCVMCLMCLLKFWFWHAAKTSMTRLFLQQQCMLTN